MKKDNSSIVGVLIFIILFILLIYYVNVIAPNKCIKNNGIVVRTNIGIYEKCIYRGNDNE